MNVPWILFKSFYIKKKNRTLCHQKVIQQVSGTETWAGSQTKICTEGPSNADKILRMGVT